MLGERSAERAFYPGVWDLFGGHVELGELPEQTLARELREELGITPTQSTLLEALTASLPEPADQLIVHLYLVTAWIGTPANLQPEEHQAIGWFTLAEATPLQLAEARYPAIFERYLDSNSGP